MVKETKFNDAWLSPTLNPEWSSWLQKVECNPHQAKCLICVKGHTTADKFLEAFVSSFDPIILPKLVEVSRDGPTVNWSFIEKVEDKLQESDDDPILLKGGSCGLHTTHRASKVGATASNWNLNVYLKNLHGLFKNSSVKREHYVNITGSNRFPEKFCDCRWLENSSKFIFALIDNPYLYMF